MRGERWSKLLYLELYLESRNSPSAPKSGTITTPSRIGRRCSVKYENLHSSVHRSEAKSIVPVPKVEPEKPRTNHRASSEDSDPRAHLVPGAGPLTPGAPRVPIGAGTQAAPQGRPPALFPEPDGAVHESGLLLQPIQDSLDLHPVLATSCDDDWFAPPSSQSRERDAHIAVLGTRPPTSRIPHNISGGGAPVRAQRAILLVDAGSHPLRRPLRFHPQIYRKTQERRGPKTLLGALDVLHQGFSDERERWGA